MEFWKRAVISFGKAEAFFEAGVKILQENRIGSRPQGRVNSSVPDCNP